MGHLVNAIGTRLGWTNLWKDNWFSLKKFYCDYLYSCFRVRFFLISMFFTVNYDRMGYFFSHFLIKINYGILYVDILFYNGVLETEKQNLHFDVKTTVKQFWKERKRTYKDEKRFRKYDCIQKKRKLKELDRIRYKKEYNKRSLYINKYNVKKQFKEKLFFNLGSKLKSDFGK